MRFARRLAVLAALGFAVAWLAPRLAGWRRIVQGGVDAFTGKTAVDIGQDLRRDILQGSLARAIDQYRAAEGAEPADLAALVDAGLLQRADLRDEWGRPIAAERSAGRLVVRGLGPDGERATGDDWTFAP
jgi:hypothetical protein